MKLLKTSLLLLPLLCSAAFGQEQLPPYWKVDDVTIGMKGVGRTVMKGNEIEEFDAEVIGVLRKAFPQQDLILARLSGLDLEKTGIIQGMSGSPVYVDGKLLGSVSYGWSFSKDPIAGITPAENMYDLYQAEDAQPQKAVRHFDFRKLRSPEAASADMAPASPVENANNQQSVRKLRAPLAISGCPPKVFDHFAKKFEAYGLMPIQGGGGAGNVQGAEHQAGDVPTLVPGSPVAITFIDGDMSMSGVGTVTGRSGDKVIAFGHPMMSLGRISLPMAVAEVNAVIPSMYSSFKLASAGKIVGTLNIDRTEGICGKIGELPRMIPMTVSIQRDDFPGEATYNYRFCESQFLTPMLLEMSLFTTVYTKGEPPSEFTISYDVDITTENDQRIHLEDIASSSVFKPMWSFFDSVAGTAGALMNNPFQDTKIKNIEAHLKIKRGDAGAFINNVRLNEVKVAPGGTAHVTVQLQQYREKKSTLQLEVPVPKELPPGVYNLIITDSFGAEKADANALPSMYDPQNYDDLLKLLRFNYPGNRIYAVIKLPETGVAVRGAELANLPASYLSMLTPVGRSKVDTVGSVYKISKETNFHITGQQMVQLVVKKED